MHIITLIEHILDDNDALLFCMHMKSLKMECIRTATTTKNQHSYQEPPDYIDHKIIEKLKGEYIVKTLLCTIQHCLSFPNQSKKTYSFEKSNPLELSRAADEAFVICRFVNPHCSHGLFTTSSNAELPHDPCYDVILQNRCKNQIPTVVLYFPSTGTYYSP